MANVRCPKCGKSNPSKLEECQYCGTRLKPVAASTPVDSKPIKAGEDPTKRDTSEFESVKPANIGPIHPGEAPTEKDTGELERSLPAWLRSLRAEKDPAENAFEEVPASDDELLSTPGPIPAPASSTDSGSSDWLSGLGKVASDEDEQIPDWLAGLRGDKPGASAQTPVAKEPAPEPDSTDWMARLGGESQAVKPGTSVNGLSEEGTVPGTTPGSVPGEALPDWIQSLKSSDAGSQESPPASKSEEVFPDWLSGLPGISGENIPGSTGSEEPAPADNTPDWLKRLKKDDAAGPGPVSPGESSESTPDWLSGFGSEPGTPTSSTGESVPDWLSNLESKPGAGSAASSVVFNSDSPPAEPSAGETPDWLSKMQADVNAAAETEKHKDDFEVVPETPASEKGIEPTPGWLSGVDSTKPPSSGTPALIAEGTDGLRGDTAFSMETPDWLSKLKPEQDAEKSTETREERLASDDIKTSELPSWVQAMRPVESVISEATGDTKEDTRGTEQNGPLAGLSGVLPFGPGLGQLRKPPAYSVKLQVSDGQQRYAAFLERMVAGETHPRAVEAAHLKSNRLWRWLITALLFLALGLPLATGAQLTPAASLLSSDKSSAKFLVDGIPANAPVLIAFDYDPALSGELEAAAAPLVDQLLAKGTRLTLISTSPTGPALAERFLRFTPLVNSYQYRNGDQYVNLGYLAGGPAGILYFATDPQKAAPNTVSGAPAWGLVPLQGIRSLSDFRAVIILTDNGDTGRNWIEQAGSRLGNTPMLMIISAQAGPMIRPYFDSGQIKGLVSGLEDAKIYEQDYNRPGLAHRYWNSFSLGLVVAELLIAIGAILGVVAELRSRRSGSREKA